jgi:hypothetical protein
MPLYELFLIFEHLEKNNFGAIRKVLLNLHDKKSILVGINYYGNARLPYRIKKYEEFKYEGR